MNAKFNLFFILFASLITIASSATELPDLIVDGLWTDSPLVLTNQEFTIGYKVKNNSSVEIPNEILIDSSLFVNDKFHSSLNSEGFKARQTSHGNWKISIDKPGDYILRLELDQKEMVEESNENNNSREISVKVHNYETYLQDCLNIHIRTLQMLEWYESGELKKKELHLGLSILARYSDQLALLSGKIKPDSGMEQFDQYMTLGVKELSVALWCICTGLSDYGKDFRIPEVGIVQLGEPYIKKGKELLKLAHIDIMIALCVLLN